MASSLSCDTRRCSMRSPLERNAIIAQRRGYGDYRISRRYSLDGRTCRLYIAGASPPDRIAVPAYAAGFNHRSNSDRGFRGRFIALLETGGRHMRGRLLFLL